MKRLINIVIWILICLSITSCTKADLVPMEYLSEHARIIDLEKTPLPESESSENPYTVFLSGESHIYQKSYQLQKFLIQYLYEQEGVRVILSEMGLGKSVLLDEYLQTGDSYLLSITLGELKGTFSNNQQNREFWEWLYEFNRSLPEGEKLHLVGLDIEHQEKSCAIALYRMSKRDQEIPEGLKTTIPKLFLNPTYGLWELVEIAKMSPDLLKEYYNEDYRLVRLILDNLEQSELYYSQRPEANGDTIKDLRDQQMMKNFFYAYEKYPGEKMFGQFGSEHIYQRALESKYGSKEWRRFGMLLQEPDSPVRGQVCSILALYYFDGKPEEGLDSYFDDGSFTEYLSQDHWIHLDRQNSPFSQTELLFHDKSTGGVSTDYVQQLIILTDSPKVEMLE